MIFSNVKSSKILRFNSVTEAHGLICPKISVLFAYSPLRSDHSPEQDFLRNACTLSLKPCFLTSLTDLHHPYRAFIWQSIGDEDSCTWHESSSPIKFQMKTRSRVFHWVSHSIHMTRTQESNWKVRSWIINEFEDIISKMLRQPNFFYSQPSTLPKDLPAKFYLSTTYGLSFMIVLYPLPDHRLLAHI